LSRPWHWGIAVGLTGVVHPTESDQGSVGVDPDPRDIDNLASIKSTRCHVKRTQKLKCLH
jgi:hypothetical protein